MSLTARDKCGLGQLGLATDGPGPGERQRRRGGELGGRFVGTWTCRDASAKKRMFAAIAQNCGREGLHIMTAPMALMHEGCGTGHITVGGADTDLRNAIAIASDGVGQSRALSVASRAGVGLKTRDKCGFRHPRLATDGPGPGERQRRRARKLRGWGVRV